MDNARHSKLFLVPTPPKSTKSRCPKCASRKVLVDHDPTKGTWFDWYKCGDCGYEWQTDEEFPGHIVPGSVKFYPAK